MTEATPSQLQSSMSLWSVVPSGWLQQSHTSLQTLRQLITRDLFLQQEKTMGVHTL